MATPHRIELIDYLRGYAIMTIVLMHCVMGSVTGVWRQATALGGAGVHVFLLCSGFGLYLSHMRRPLTYGAFLRRRFARIYWPYVGVVVLWALWTWVRSGSPRLDWVAAHVLLYKMFDHGLDTSFAYPLWFISTIVQFYLAWPMLVRLMERRAGLVVSLAVSLAWATLVGALGLGELRPWGSCFLQYLWEFCLGMWLARRYGQRLTADPGTSAHARPTYVGHNEFTPPVTLRAHALTPATKAWLKA